MCCPMEGNLEVTNINNYIKKKGNLNRHTVAIMDFLKIQQKILFKVYTNVFKTSLPILWCE